jgi:hypothetical protein
LTLLPLSSTYFAGNFSRARIFIKTDEEGGHMKPKVLSVAVFAFLVLFLAGGANSWPPEAPLKTHL